MSNLSSDEKNIAVQLLNQGYRKAAASFSVMTNEQISIKPTRIEVSSNDWKILKNLKSSDDLVVVTTSIMGELSGKSYLLINRSEAEAIYNACVSEEQTEEEKKEETEAILKELDNILSAAVITEFSNYTNAMIYGDVPILYYTNQFEIRNKIVNDFKGLESGNEYFMLADTEFISENNSKLRPQFVWKLTKSFVERIKECVAKQNKVL